MVVIWVTLAGGIGALAFRRPLVFWKLHNAVSILFLAIVILLNAWAFGGLATWEAMMPFVKPDQGVAAAKAAREATYIVNALWFVGGLALVWLALYVVETISKETENSKNSERK